MTEATPEEFQRKFPELYEQMLTRPSSGDGHIFVHENGIIERVGPQVPPGGSAVDFASLARHVGHRIEVSVERPTMVATGEPAQQLMAEVSCRDCLEALLIKQEGE